MKYVKTVSLFILLFLTSCTKDIKYDYDKTLINSYERLTYSIDKDDITNPEEEDNFIHLYGLLHLVSHKVYLQDDSIQIDFFFNGDAERTEIQSARGFAIGKFVIGSTGKIGGEPYDEIALENVKEPFINSVYCRIFIEDSLLFQDTYDRGSLYLYEDTDEYSEVRKCDNIDIDELEALIRRDYKKAVITLQNSLIGNALLIQIKYNQTINPDKVKDWEQYIETVFSKQAYKKSTLSSEELFDIIVLQIRDEDNELFYESAFLNIDGQEKWLLEDWMNYKVVPVTY